MDGITSLDRLRCQINTYVLLKHTSPVVRLRSTLLHEMTSRHSVERITARGKSQINFFVLTNEYSFAAEKIQQVNDRRERQREYIAVQRTRPVHRQLPCSLTLSLSYPQPKPCHTLSVSPLIHSPTTTLRRRSSLRDWRTIKIHLIELHLQFPSNLLELRMSSPVHFHVLSIVQNIIHISMKHHVVGVGPSKRVNSVQMVFSITICEPSNRRINTGELMEETLLTGFSQVHSKDPFAGCRVHRVRQLSWSPLSWCHHLSRTRRSHHEQLGYLKLYRSSRRMELCGDPVLDLVVLDLCRLTSWKTLTSICTGRPELFLHRLLSDFSVIFGV